MNIYELIQKRRTIRNFSPRKIEKKIIDDCLNAAHLAPSAANLQPLEYLVITENLEVITPHIHWAGYLQDQKQKGNNRPQAFAIILSNNNISQNCKIDVGLSTENLILTALGYGLASCVLGPIKPEELMKKLSIPENYSINLIIALGYPEQESFVEKYEGDQKYWVDEQGNLHVPKKITNKIIHYNQF
jgi:nitroreductase